MNKLVDGLRQLRASNIVFVFMVPIIVYFLITSRNYLPALKAVLGVEENAFELLFGFLNVSIVSVSIFFAALYSLKSIRIDQKVPVVLRSRKLSSRYFLIALFFSSIFHLTAFIDAYAISIMANSSDPRSSDWIIVVNQSFLLTPEFEVVVRENVRLLKNVVSLAATLFFFFSLLPITFHKTNVGKSLIYLMIMVGSFSSFYFLMLAHAGFAVGLMITLRAAFFAYFGASVLGLVWALLTKLSPSRRSSQIHLFLATCFILTGVLCLSQDHKEVGLIGDVNGKIGVISGTPQWVTDTIRYGDFLDNPPEKPFKIRSLRSLEQGISLLDKESISALILPKSEIFERTVIWETSYLPKKQKYTGITAIAIGSLLILFVAIGAISNLHPLAVFSDFFVDTIRGIPMIVIILYIGLPLAGALKNVSGGYMDMEMLTRGIIAISVGYSAYMAEIFRAGIEAIPKGQIEAARTLGLREHHVARFVIIPQAIAIVLPALGNEFIAMLKDTSLLSILSIRDITQRMREFQAQSFLAFEPFNTAALLYVFLTLLAASGIKSLDKIVNRNRASEK